MDRDKNGAAITECKQKMAKCNAQIADKRRTIERLEEKIERLKRVRDVASIKKVEVGMTNSTMVEDMESLTYFMWCGSNRCVYDWKSIEVLLECVTFKIEVDNLQDALNDEITRLEDEQYEYEGIVGQLKIVFNDLSNWLTNLLN